MLTGIGIETPEDVGSGVLLEPDGGDEAQKGVPVLADPSLIDCGKACKDDPLGGKSASSITHLVWLQKLLFVVQRWKGKRG